MRGHIHAVTVHTFVPREAPRFKNTHVASVLIQLTIIRGVLLRILYFKCRLLATTYGMHINIIINEKY